VVSLAGELDLATVPVAERPLLGELESEGTLIVDLTRLSFIDSSGIALLLQALRVDGGSRLCTVVARDSQVERVFRLAGIDRALALHFDRQAAAAALNAVAYGEADRVDSTEIEDES
jgi:anti-sigma B factor antagonist